MAWRIKARMYESCSCKMLCPCTLGPAEPDQGWCSGAFGVQVLEGESDGVDLSGAVMVLHAQLEGDFLGGIDKAKLYLDSSLSDDQKRELDAIIHGEKGGLWGGMREAISEFMPSATAKITITEGENPNVKVDGMGEITLEALKTEDGRRATLNNGPVAVGFGQDVLELAIGKGSKFNDPEMRAWESLGYGSVSTVEWSG